jgi:predicted DsbA family dithiol-disulfide isomerase
MKIEIWADYACPFCYIGKVTLDQAIEQLKLHDQIEIVHKAFQLDPNAPKVSNENTIEHLVNKYRVSLSDAENMVNNVVHHANRVGLNLRFDLVKQTNTFDAHRMTKLAKSLNLDNELNNVLYKAYFESGKNLADLDILNELGNLSGIENDLLKEMLNSNLFELEVKRDIEEANRKSIHAVPYFLFDGKRSIKGAQSLNTFLEMLKDLK